MKTIALISCVSKKLPYPAKACDLYISPLFRLNLAYANKLCADSIYILSAKYGLLDIDAVIEPYDATLNTMPDSQIRVWAQQVVKQIKDNEDVATTHFVLLAGNKYRKYLLPHLLSYEVPLEGLTIGKQLQRLKRLVYE
ncbi:MAG: hypothetical protein Q8Q28_11810 [Pseudomonadota bacterium]|nr:hypothetical protein [Pseudomonadota bacterium]